MAEALHAHTLVRPAFQQIQLDVHFLRAPLQGFVAGSYEEPAVLQVGGRQSFVCPQMRHGSAKCR